MESTTEERAAQAPARPVLLHAGTYALYRTPAGGLHVTFRRTSAPDDDGQLRLIEDAPDEHLPEMPPALVAMFEAQQEGHQLSRMDMLRGLAAMMGGRLGGRAPEAAEAELAALEGSPYGDWDKAGEHSHRPDDEPCPGCGWPPGYWQLVDGRPVPREGGPNAG